MALDPAAGASLRCTIATWLSVRNSAQAVEFYQSAFGAAEVFAWRVLEEVWWRDFPSTARSFGRAMNLRSMRPRPHRYGDNKS